MTTFPTHAMSEENVPKHHEVEVMFLVSERDEDDLEFEPRRAYLEADAQTLDVYFDGGVCVGIQLADVFDVLASR